MLNCPRVVPDISVVMGTYNGEKFVREQLETILRQTLLPYEIIVSDDASIDRTCEIVEDVASNSPIPVVLRRNGEQLGFSENFLQASHLARAPYIAFSDQDDRWAPEKLERGLAALVDHGAVLSSHLVDKIDADGVRLDIKKPRRKEPLVIGPRDADPWGNFYGFTMLFQRSLLDRIAHSARGLDPHTHDAVLSHDRWVWFLASTFGSMVLVDERLAEYRQHSSQLYGGLTPRSLRERLTTKLADGERQSLHLTRVAGERARLLASPQGPHPGPWLAGARRWQSIESNLLASAALYGRSTRRRRLVQLLRNFVCHVYGSPANGGLSSRRMRQDLAVVLARLIVSTT